MLEFYAEKFSNICRLLGELCVLPIDDNFERIEFSQPILDELTWLRETAKGLGLRGSAVSAERLLTDLRSPTSRNAEIRRRGQELLQRIIDEFNGQFILAIPLRSSQFYKMDGTILGEDVLCRFQSLERDAREAGNCFALGRYTACVFHLMRIMEEGLNVLAMALDVAVEQNWYKLLNAIEKEIRRRNERPTDEWKQIRSFYAEAATHFRMVKDAWRNHTMHIKAFYGEEEAKDILNSVRAFMRHLATKLHEGPDGENLG